MTYLFLRKGKNNFKRASCLRCVFSMPLIFNQIIWKHRPLAVSGTAYLIICGQMHGILNIQYSSAYLIGSLIIADFSSPDLTLKIVTWEESYLFTFCGNFWSSNFGDLQIIHYHELSSIFYDTHDWCIWYDPSPQKIIFSLTLKW